MLSVVLWDPYREKLGRFSSLVSGNKENILEKSLGVRSQWKVEKSFFVQEWVAGISGVCNTAGLNTKPFYGSNR